MVHCEALLCKDYDCKGSIEKKISGRDPQGAWCQDELIGGKPPVWKSTVGAMGQLPAGKDVNMEAEGIAGIFYQAMVSEDTEDLVCAVVRSRVCELVTVLVKICKCSINPTNT
jgi:hypothetical protein